MMRALTHNKWLEDEGEEESDEEINPSSTHSNEELLSFSSRPLPPAVKAQ